MFTNEDLSKYLGLKKIISCGEFSIKGEAALPAASCFLWLNDLEKKIRDDIASNKVKPIGEPKKIGA